MLRVFCLDCSQIVAEQDDMTFEPIDTGTTVVVCWTHQRRPYVLAVGLELIKDQEIHTIKAKH